MGSESSWSHIQERVEGDRTKYGCWEQMFFFCGIQRQSGRGIWDYSNKLAECRTNDDFTKKHGALSNAT